VAKRKVTLVGPFVGELFWELFRFAPFIINFKKENPEKIIIVFTRPERFDLYGKYVNVLVPLRIKGDRIEDQECFRLSSFEKGLYSSLATFFMDSYKKQFTIENHFYPDCGWRYNLKWQFPRDKMNYDFQPRKENYDIVEKLVGEFKKIVLVKNLDNNYIDYLKKKEYKVINIKTLPSFCDLKSTDISFIGIMIELIRRCNFIVSETTSILGQLSLLLNKPLITIKEKIDFDSLNLVNPLKTKVILCSNLGKGIENYENNFRS